MHTRALVAIVVMLVLLASLFVGLFQYTAEAGGAVSVTRNFSPTADTYVNLLNTTYNYGFTDFVLV